MPQYDTSLSVHVTGSDLQPNGEIRLAEATYTGDTAFCIIIDREHSAVKGCCLGTYNIDVIRTIIEQLIESCGEANTMLAIMDILQGAGASADFLEGLVNEE